MTGDDGWWLVYMFGMHAALLLSRCNIMQEENNVILAKVITPLRLAGSDNTVPRRARSKARPSCVAARTFNGGGNPINSLLDRGWRRHREQAGRASG